MYEIEDSPEEFAADIEEAFWATVTPTERQRLLRDYEERGREAIQEVVDEQLRDDLAEREEYVEAMVDGLVEALNG